MSEEIGIDRLLLTYLFDPDEGLAQEITELLNTQSKYCDEVEGHAAICAHGGTVQKIYLGKLEVAEADLEFYTDVWVKIRAATGEKAEVEPKQESVFTPRSQIASDIGLFEFLVSVGQRKYNNSIDRRFGLADELISRGWKK